MSTALLVVVDGVIYQAQARGGISRIYSEILPRLCDLDDSLHITLLTEGKLQQTLPAHARITHLALPPIKRYLRPGRFWRPVVPRVRDFVLAQRVGRGVGEVWHSTYYTSPGAWRGPRVVTVYDMIHERLTDLFNRPGDSRFRADKRRCVQQADAVICISETTRQDVLHFHAPDPSVLHVIPLGYSAIFRPLRPSDGDPAGVGGQPFLLYVGTRLPRYKFFDGLAQAYSQWLHQRDVSLVLVGPPWVAGEERFLADLGVRERVHLLASVDDATLCRLYNQALAFVYPSHYEGFGIPLLEAMACGCPVVASRIPSTMEVAGECPIYFEPGQVESLRAALDFAFTEARDEARAQAGITQAQRYSWDRTARQTLQVYHALS